MKYVTFADFIRHQYVFGVACPFISVRGVGAKLSQRTIFLKMKQEKIKVRIVAVIALEWT